MTESHLPGPPAGPRAYNVTVLVGVVVAVLVVGFAAWFAVLPYVQRLTLPAAAYAAGPTGPWGVRPTHPFRYGSAAVLDAFTLPIVAGRIRRRWRAAAGPGSRRPRRSGRQRVGDWLVVLMIAAFGGGATAFYLDSWEVVGPDGITQHLPWRTRTYHYDEVTSLGVGTVNRDDPTSGTKLQLRLTSGRYLYVGADADGMTEPTLTAIRAYVARRTGLMLQRGIN